LITYVMVKMSGVETHALLVVGVEKTEKGMKVYFLDPNAGFHLLESEYHDGDSQFWQGVPYIQDDSEIKSISEVLKKECE
jgi:hypothetical protein